MKSKTREVNSSSMSKRSTEKGEKVQVMKSTKNII